jgi:hypothetical protein
MHGSSRIRTLDSSEAIVLVALCSESTAGSEEKCKDGKTHIENLDL